MNQVWQKIPQIALCATMSAGKSTLINAMLGSNYIPTSNFSCTAKVMSLLNYSVGDDLIAAKLTADGKLTESSVQNYEILRDWNNDREVIHIYLAGELQNIFVPIVLNDTPGTNSSNNAEHMKVTQDFLTTNTPALIIFVINAENIGADDERNLLLWLKTELEEKKSVEIIFVLNKLDSFDTERENISEVMFGVEKYLSDLGFENLKIFPLSAEAALFFRMLTVRKKFTRLEKIKLKFLYEHFAEEKFQVEQNLIVQPFVGTDEIINFDGNDYKISDLHEAIQRTGICALEKFIENKFWEVR